MKNKNVYHINNAIKLGKYNVGREGEILTIPLYMGFLVVDKMTDVIIPDVDVDSLLKGLSFTNYNAVQTPEFVGLTNYINLLTQDTIFLQYVLPNPFRFYLLIFYVSFHSVDRWLFALFFYIIN